MKTHPTLLLLIAVAACANAAQPDPVPSDDDQIAAALQAAPDDRREGARVIAPDGKGGVKTLREGTNDLICLADDPADATFSVSCYHASLEPYMAHGRKLRAEGLDGKERLEKRWADAEAGLFPMPDGAATLYVLTGKKFDAEAGEVVDPYLRWVVYIPGATAESTGLPLAPTGPGAPWIMFPGTPGAHIMISPPTPGAKVEEK